MVHEMDDMGPCFESVEQAWQFYRHAHDKYDPEEELLALFVTRLSIPDSIAEAEGLIYREWWKLDG